MENETAVIGRRGKEIMRKEKRESGVDKKGG